MYVHFFFCSLMIYSCMWNIIFFWTLVWSFFLFKQFSLIDWRTTDSLSFFSHLLSSNLWEKEFNRKLERPTKQSWRSFKQTFKFLSKNQASSPENTECLKVCWLMLTDVLTHDQLINLEKTCKKRRFETKIITQVIFKKI